MWERSREASRSITGQSACILRKSCARSLFKREINPGYITNPDLKRQRCRVSQSEWLVQAVTLLTSICFYRRLGWPSTADQATITQHELTLPRHDYFFKARTSLKLLLLSHLFYPSLARCLQKLCLQEQKWTPWTFSAFCVLIKSQNSGLLGSMTAGLPLVRSLMENDWRKLL